METNITIWPFLITVTFMAIVIGIHWLKQRPRAIKLSSCYGITLDKKLIINELPAAAKVPQAFYHDYIDLVVFNIYGDVFILREIDNHAIWHHFGPRGEDLGLVKKGELTKMRQDCPKLHLGQCKSYKVNKNGRITVYLQ